MSKIKVLIDTNVVLDSIFQRGDFYAYAKAIFKLSEDNQIEGCISSSAVTDIFYLARKEFKDTEFVYRIVDTLTSVLTILPVLDTTIKKALALRWKDFEDAVQYITAVENNVTRIVTRNVVDFEVADIAVSPWDYLTLVNGAHQEEAP
jgi:predicted nucleic acid-binding protein